MKTPTLTTERACRYCGCTDDHACPGGCAWVAPDVCSSRECVERAYFERVLSPDICAQIEDPIEPIYEQEPW